MNYLALIQNQSWEIQKLMTQTMEQQVEQEEQERILFRSILKTKAKGSIITPSPTPDCNHHPPPHTTPTTTCTAPDQVPPYFQMILDTPLEVHWRFPSNDVLKSCSNQTRSQTPVVKEMASQPIARKENTQRKKGGGKKKKKEQEKNECLNDGRLDTLPFLPFPTLPHASASQPSHNLSSCLCVTYPVKIIQLKESIHHVYHLD